VIGRWAARNAVRHPIRTGLVVLGIAVASALLLDMTMLSGGMERSFENMLLSRGFQIRMSPKGTLPFDTEATVAGVTPIVAALRSDPAIAAAGAAVGIPVHVRKADSLVTLVGYGVDPKGQGFYQVLEGSDLAPGDSAGMLVGAPAAARLGWRLGDTVRLLGRLDPQSAEAGIERLMTVRAVVRWLYDSRDQLSVGGPYRVVRAMGRFVDPDPGSMIMIKVREGHDVDSVATRLAARYPGVQVNSVAALVRQFRNRLVYFQQLSLILATISLVVAVLLVATILAITVNERLGEVAVLRAIGVTRARLVGLVLIEAAAVTAVGTGLGIGLGLVTAGWLDDILTSFPGLPAAISFFVPEPAAMFRATTVMIGAGLGAAGYPAWLAARAPIALTLRSEAE